ncbi:amino acid ABC transporter permease [Aerococcus urinaehominis]|uniref:Amino acid ABC transporter permease n=1 Tax=Aerococcus urinaehominis TaxID=128944 RepID=A0A0X8FM60_9LACT|nr:amino acid ABC transporter permease [Aerococcus urinaehominis]AMB99839.1 amino acid ABC transporter permease [Aerococcus urinaehominis]SDM62769.1 polar amino acid transport system permease protein [Aerococcus urinaehominis]
MSGYEVIFAGQNLARIFAGLVTAGQISLLSLILGLPLGIILGILRTLGRQWVEVILKLYLEMVRILPLLVLLYVFYYSLPQVSSATWSNFTVSVLVFVIWVSAEVSDLVQAAIRAIPKSQLDSARALALSPGQIYRYVILPQCLRSLIAPCVNLITRVFKSTSILLMIGVDEIIRIGTQIIENYTYTVPTASFWVYGFIFCLCFAICFPISQLSKYLEKRLGKELS